MTPSGPLLIMAQIDDAPGELLGHLIEELTTAGAINMQLLSSLGKKGRPGYVLLVDIHAEDEPVVAALLAGELGIWGYRVLQSEHKHFDIRHYRTQLEVGCGGTVSSFPLRVKRILHAGEFLRAKAEHDDLVAIAAQLRSHRPTPVAVLKAAIETAVGSREPGDVVRICLDDRTSME
jgi:uncharacterized protein (DUF111 family)